MTSCGITGNRGGEPHRRRPLLDQVFAAYDDGAWMAGRALTVYDRRAGNGTGEIARR